ncbi:MAG: amidase [Pseudomonadales bacterium]
MKKAKKINRRQFLHSTAGLGAALAIPVTTGCSTSAGATAKNQKPLPADITELTASQLSVAIKQRQVSCTEVVQAYLKRIDRYNPVYNAIVSMPDQEHLISQAAAADKALAKGEYRGWMHGMPHAVKDLADVKGLPTIGGSPLFVGTTAKKDSIFVERIRRQGAIFIGKTNVPEFGLGSQSYNPVFGATRCAYNPALTAGGSSGGAATGMATHMLPVADGSDMMGSLRNPAAFNNVIGFRPSRGRVPKGEADLFFQQLGYSGPMGRTVEDTIRLLGTMSGYDSRAPMSLRDHVKPFERVTVKQLSEYKLGWMGNYDGYLSMEPGLLDLNAQALKQLASNGAVVEDCKPDYDMARLWQTWLTLRHWTVCGGLKALYDDQRARPHLKPELVWEIEGGLNLSGLDVSAASRARSDWYLALHKLFSQYDFLVLPTTQLFPFSADLHWPKAINGKPMDTYHRWMEVVIGGTLSGCPVVNLPAGFDEQGRPAGLQFIGPVGEDSKLLGFALAYEASVNHLATRPVLKESGQHAA